MSELLLGAGSRHEKRLAPPGREQWKNLVTLDFNSDHNPDVVHDLTKLPYPFSDNQFEEVHAYDVMEHLGQQGDWRWFFDQWSELYRILAPGGHFCGISPHWSSPWAWGDPGHTRIIGPECMVFLSQVEYLLQVGKTPMTDYRFCYKADFDPVHFTVTEDGSFVYVLKAIKPARTAIPPERQPNRAIIIPGDGETIQ